MKYVKNQIGSSLEAVFLIIILVCFGIVGLFLMANEDDYDLIEMGTHELVALQDNISTDGDFFLGSGNINSEMYYYYMYKNEAGGHKQEKISVEDSTVFYLENETDKPKVEIFKAKYKGFGGVLLNLMKAEESKYKYEVYVQKGSIIEDVTIDLK